MKVGGDWIAFGLLSEGEGELTGKLIKCKAMWEAAFLNVSFWRGHWLVLEA